MTVRAEGATRPAADRRPVTGTPDAPTAATGAPARPSPSGARSRSRRSCRSASRARSRGRPSRRPAARWHGPGSAATVGYHRIDDRSRAGGGRLPPALPGSPTWFVRHARAVAEVAAGWRPGSMPRGIGVDRRLVEAAALLHDADKALPADDPLRALPHGEGSAAWLTRRGHPELARAVAGHPVTRLADGEASAVGRVRVARGADRRLRRQAGRAAPRVDGRPVRLVAPALPADGPATAIDGAWDDGDVRARPRAGGAARGGRLPGGRRRTRGPPAPMDRCGAAAARARSRRGQGRRDDRRRRSPTSGATTSLRRPARWMASQAALGAETGAPPERWDLRGDRNAAGEQIARLNERVATPAMFGGGSLAVVTEPGPLVQATEHRAAFLAALGARRAGQRPGHPRRHAVRGEGPVAETARRRGGRRRRLDPPYESPRRPALAGWIEAEARRAWPELAPGAAKALAERIGGFVDAERRRAAVPDPDRRRSSSTSSRSIAATTRSRPTTSGARRRGHAGLGLGVHRRRRRAPARRRRSSSSIACSTSRPNRSSWPSSIVASASCWSSAIASGRASGCRRRPRRWGSTATSAPRPLAPRQSLDDGRADGRARRPGRARRDGQGRAGSGQDEAQRRLAFSLWVMDHADRGPAPSWRRRGRGA